MSDEGRRGFLRRSAAAVTGLALGASAPREVRGTPAAAARPVDPQVLRAVGRIALPSEGGEERLERRIAGFEAWLEGFEPVAERPHGYGSQEILYGPPHPGPRWQAQLEALELEAEKRHGRGFADLRPEDGRELLDRHVEAADDGDLPGEPARASHVATGLLAWFYASPEATDLCYGRRIGKLTCRPLDAAPAEPAALGDGS